MIRLRDVSVVFNRTGQNAFHALRNLDLTLAPGTFLTLVGSNGAGKSTLLNVLAGATIPSSGAIEVDGRDVTTTPDHARASWLARVFPDPKTGTCDGLSIEENLALALSRNGRRGLRPPLAKAARSMLRDKLASLGLGLENRLDTPAECLSSGQRQSLTVLMATLGEPKLLLLDEHIANLDPKTQQIVLDLTDRTIRELGLTVIMVTHDVRHALRYGHRLIAMDRGTIVLDVSGDAKSCLTPQAIEAVYGGWLN